MTDSPLTGCRGKEAYPAPLRAVSDGPFARMFREVEPDWAEEIDPRTGLRNWLALQRRYDRLLQSGRPTAAFTTIHLQNYDTVLRQHGDTIANMLLAFTAQLLTKELQPDDCLGYCGDGDFMLMLPDGDEDGMCATLARFGLALLCHPFPLPAGGSEVVRISAGDERFVKSGAQF